MLASFAVTVSPSTTISPAVGSSNMFRHHSRVDLPMPERPMMEMTSPFSISTLTSENGVTLG
ncbi:MAG: hypothetical protein RRY79_06135 [Clostridia bacterium]